MMKAPLMKKLIPFTAIIMAILLFALFQEALAAGAGSPTGGANVVKTHPISTTNGKKIAARNAKKNFRNSPKPPAGSTLITYTYDNNGNLIGKTKVAGP